MKRFVARPQPRISPLQCFWAGLGGAIAIAAMSYPTKQTDMVWLFCAVWRQLRFAFFPADQPLITTHECGDRLCGGRGLRFCRCQLSAVSFLPDVWWSVALSVGAAIALMAYFRVTHPPAGAAPLVVFASHPDLTFLLFPVLTGAAGLVALATVYHRLRGHAYPVGG